MKNPLKKPIDGSKLIADAIGRFALIADEIETGITVNLTKVVQNEKAMETLADENSRLTAVAEHGQTVARRLRDLIT
jgi:hypothetical protein